MLSNANKVCHLLGVAMQLLVKVLTGVAGVASQHFLRKTKGTLLLPNAFQAMQMTFWLLQLSAQQHLRNICGTPIACLTCHAMGFHVQHNHCGCLMFHAVGIRDLTAGLTGCAIALESDSLVRLDLQDLVMLDVICNTLVVNVGQRLKCSERTKVVEILNAHV